MWIKSFAPKKANPSHDTYNTKGLPLIHGIEKTVIPLVVLSREFPALIARSDLKSHRKTFPYPRNTFPYPCREPQVTGSPEHSIQATDVSPHNVPDIPRGPTKHSGRRTFGMRPIHNADGYYNYSVFRNLLSGPVRNWKCLG